MQFLIDIGLSFLYVCIFLLFCAWIARFWVMYVNQKHLNNIDWLMLEIKLPREIMKSPLATEMAIATLLQGGGIGNAYSKYWNGNLPVYSSLEIASTEGVIHFYVRIQKKFKELVSANFYAQYPGIEIIEAEDYTSKIKYDHLSKDTSFWGITFKTAQTWTPTNEETGEPFKDGDKNIEMSADFLPIKTYVDYGLDKDPKEEFKIDPLTPLLEMMGSLKKGEHMWYQVLLVDESVYAGGKKFPKFYVNEGNHKHMSLADMAKERKKQIRTASWKVKDKVALDEYGIPKMIDVFDKNYVQQFGDDEKPKKEIFKHKETKAILKDETKLTQDEKDELEAINRKLSKPLALCALRLVYVTKKESFRVEQIQSTLGFSRPFKGMNGFKPNVSNPYEYPWQDVGKRRSAWRSEEMFEAFVEREAFFPHIPEREGLQLWEDRFFYASSMRQRKIFRMFYEALLYPFEHPHAEEVFCLNLEEIATLWHLPGATAATPTLPRIDSTKGIAPVNLPI